MMRQVQLTAAALTAVTWAAVTWAAVTWAAVTAHAAPLTFTSLLTFSSKIAGSGPTSLAYLDGKIYGVTAAGGIDDGGVLYTFDPATSAKTILYKFSENNVNGFFPIAVTAEAGNLYISSVWGGVGPLPGSGTIYKYNPNTGVQGKLFDFAEIDVYCFANAVLAKDGYLYGTCPGSGNDYGIVFKVNKKKDTGTILFTFQNGPEGGYPAGPVVYANGVLYGAIQSISNDFVGGLFSFDPSTGKETIIHHFTQGTEGGQPQGLADCGGTLYGFNETGGANAEGTAFAFDVTTKTESTVYTFQGGTDSQPVFPPAPVCDGSRVYGTAENGGAYGDGTVFEISTVTGKEKILHDFNGTDGAYPIAGLIRHEKTFYGTTLFGPGKKGPKYSGTLFQLAP